MVIETVTPKMQKYVLVILIYAAIQKAHM